MLSALNTRAPPPPHLQPQGLCGDRRAGVCLLDRHWHLVQPGVRPLEPATHRLPGGTQVRASLLRARDGQPGGSGSALRLMRTIGQAAAPHRRGRHRVMTLHAGTTALGAAGAPLTSRSSTRTTKGSRWPASTQVRGLEAFKPCRVQPGAAEGWGTGGAEVASLRAAACLAQLAARCPARASASMARRAVSGVYGERWHECLAQS